MRKPYRTPDDLPKAVPVFPLTGALLLPRGGLPLTVFEPRYLAMVDDAIAGTRLIGMIQPTEPEEQSLKPALSQVGCLGRITAFKESEDHRYQVTLTGICRFAVVAELVVDTPYRQVDADYTRFACDLALNEESDLPRDRLMVALKNYLTRRELKADWQSVMNAPPEHLVNALAMLCPFEPAEKQALLEAPGWSERVATLVALLEMSDAQAVSRSIN
jgi:Lon protease-like protein